jgi:hypothetical protein
MMMVMMMSMDHFMEWELAEEIDVLGENLPQWHFVQHKCHTISPGFEPDRRGGKSATHHLSYGKAHYNQYFISGSYMCLLETNVQHYTLQSLTCVDTAWR